MQGKVRNGSDNFAAGGRLFNPCSASLIIRIGRFGLHGQILTGLPVASSGMITTSLKDGICSNRLVDSRTSGLSFDSSQR